jgi:hypothetical protein
MWHYAPPELKFLNPQVDGDNAMVFISRFVRSAIVGMIKNATSFTVYNSDNGSDSLPNINNAIRLIAEHNPTIEKLSMSGVDGDGIAHLERFTNLRELTMKRTDNVMPCKSVARKLVKFECIIRNMPNYVMINESFVSLRYVTLYSGACIHKSVCKQLVRIDVLPGLYHAPKNYMDNYITKHDVIITRDLFPNLQRLHYDFRHDHGQEYKMRSINAAVGNPEESTIKSLFKIALSVKSDFRTETENYVFNFTYRDDHVSSIDIQKKTNNPVNLHDEVVELSNGAQ